MVQKRIMIDNNTHRVFPSFFGTADSFFLPSRGGVGSERVHFYSHCPQVFFVFMIRAVKCVCSAAESGFPLSSLHWSSLKGTGPSFSLFSYTSGVLQKQMWVSQLSRSQPRPRRRRSLLLSDVHWVGRRGGGGSGGLFTHSGDGFLLLLFLPW